MRALIIGAQPGSLGDALEAEFTASAWETVTAGVSWKEDRNLDITQEVDVAKFFAEQHPFNAVVNTAGINKPTFSDAVGLPAELEDHFLANVYGHILVWQQWMSFRPETVAYWTNHYVSISSNSAHIARSNSMPYCVSKAALSMAIRCAARDSAGKASIYAYEPGLLAGTPMTEQVRQDLQVYADEVPALHRMRSGPENQAGIKVGRLARMIVNNIHIGGPELNGSIIRIDGGEQ